ncbi:MAG: SDR family NAD(P)-dependent oxidoreductase [Candidatus Aminicenantes bacterium]|jgi:acyl transferase domain-containing protein
MNGENQQNKLTGFEAAVIGMAGRFPGARTIGEFWDNLINGKESIAFLSDDELGKNGISPEQINNANYVKSHAPIKNKEYFDSSFFGYSPREAEVMDPQLRHFHEVLWEALEDAGYDPTTYKGSIGLYAGSMNSFEWQALSVLSGVGSVMGDFAKALLHNCDLMCHRLSHRFNLRGPSFTIFSACSTSLVAIHLAYRALVTGESSMALAGGVTILRQLASGYMYEEGMIRSPDGHCRTFDAKAKGTFFGDGIGIVVLKRAKEALADGDNIYALVKGTAINNDGMNKVEFTAPSVKGESAVIRAAQRLARVTPESISYIEAHGTGTKLGDPIEISALKQVFNTGKTGFCGIGCVKTNVGHLDTAAGVAGFIKTALALKYKVIPPTLHFEQPNPEIDFENSPFYVVTTLTPWKNDTYPLRAGVSSFGIGGTNAHVILEEAPQISKSVNQWVSGSVKKESDAKEYQLILLSAKIPSALDKMTRNLAEHLKSNPDLNLADAAYTLQVGRKAFQYRRSLVCSKVNEAIDLLSSPNSAKVQTYCSKVEDPPVIFMFPGQGSQYVNMGRELYEKEPVFREEMDRCVEILKSLMGYDIKEILYPFNRSDRTNRSHKSPKSNINQTEIAQPVLFIFEYALARLLIHWGIQPYAMIGHSIGEYVAACLSGVFSLEDALKLVVLRGQLMQQIPSGSMLSVTISQEELIPLLNSKTELSLAAVNSPLICVVSGTHEAVEEMETQLLRRGYEARPLHTSHAFHSKMMEPILAEFEEKVKSLCLNTPTKAYISNGTGKRVTPEEATNPAYWAAHLRKTVYFSKGIKELLKEEGAVFVEVGPGKALSSFVRQHHTDKKIDQPGQHVVNLVRHPKETVSDEYYLLSKIGLLWIYGKQVQWTGFYGEEKRRRISLPTYPFQGQKYWLDESSINRKPADERVDDPWQRKPDMADWFYVPSWERCITPANPSLPSPQGLIWLVLEDSLGVARRLGNRLQQENNEHHIVYVKIAETFDKIQEGEYRMNPDRAEDYDALFKELRQLDRTPHQVVHCWNVIDNKDREPGLKGLEKSQNLGIYSLLNIVQALDRQYVSSDMQILVISNDMLDVLGQEELCPEKATLLGAIKIIPLEYINIKCRHLDIHLPSPLKPAAPREDSLTAQLLQELMRDSSEISTAIRGNHRWVQKFKPVHLDKQEILNPGRQRLKDGGVYLITGGLGGIGFTMAEHLAKTLKARLVLTGRSAFPPDNKWDEWLVAHDEDDDVSLKIRKLREFEEWGAKVMISSADVTHYQQMQTVINQAKERFGAINGVIHAAGVIDYAGVIQRRTRAMTEETMAARVRGTLVLEDLLKDEPLDFFVLFSFIGNVLYKEYFGQVGFISSNEFLESFAIYKTRKEGTFFMAINWADWLEGGMVIKAIHNRHKGSINSEEKIEADIQALSEIALSPAEGVEIFDRIMNHSYSRILVSLQDLEARIGYMNHQEMKEPQTPGTPDESTVRDYYERPELTTAYVAPGNEIEQKLVVIFQVFFGIRQVGIHDDFFELGGNSLIAMNVLAMIHKEINVKIPLGALFNHPTVYGLSQYAKNTETDQYTSIEPTEKKQYYPLSSAQKRLFITWQMDKQSTGYNQPEIFLLEGQVEKTKLGKAFYRVIKRHEMLRTSFATLDEEPVQIIHEPGEVKFVMEYYQTGEKEAKSLINRFIKPFDLTAIPLLAALLINLGSEKHILILNIHHIISDGPSNLILFKELITAYHGQELIPLKFQYKDFSQWYNSRMKSADMEKQKNYWLKVFTAPLPVLQLPTDYPRPERQSYQGKLLNFEISSQETTALNQLAKNRDVTLFMVLLAVYNVMLAKISGQSDIVVGIPVSGARPPDFDGLIGMFVNTLALRNFPHGSKTFEEFLTGIRETTLKAFENQDYQFEELVEQVVINRDMSRNPLFDVMFVFQNFPNSAAQSSSAPAGQDPGFVLKPYEYSVQSTRFDLILQGFERDNRLYFTLDYRSTLFKKERIDWFIKYFKDIISVVIQDPRKKISQIRTMSQSESREILSQLSEDLMN